MKKRICRIIDENDKTIKNRENQKRLYELCNRNNIPILTTNYDHKLLFGTYDKAYTDYISGGIEELKWIFSETKKTKNSTYKELFNAFFRDNSFSRLNLDIRKEFAIWPIHGSKRYSSSICINSMDYARKISEINKRLAEKQDMWEQNENWEGKYTWLNIFLHNDLIIIGLGLDTNEIDLRWLLVERYIYQKWIRQHYPKEKEGTILYLYSEYKDSKSGQIKTMERGKKLFFESLGIKCIRMNRNDLYSFEWIKEY